MKVRTVAQLKPYKKALWLYLLLAFFLASLTSSCAHKPRDINRYIHALERTERAQYQQPEKVIEALNLKPRMVVVDIGAGSGYFTRRLAEAVGDTGQVIAIDVEQKMLDYNKERLEQLGLVKRVRFILAKPDSPPIPKNSADMVFLCDVYHHLNHHVEYMAKIRSAIPPNGRVVIIDYYNDERSGALGFSKKHLVPREQVIKEMEQAGITLAKEHTFLSRQYFLEFVPNKMN